MGEKYFFCQTMFLFLCLLGIMLQNLLSKNKLECLSKTDRPVQLSLIFEYVVRLLHSVMVLGSSKGLTMVGSSAMLASIISS